MKKILSIVLALVMVFALFAAPAMAEETAAESAEMVVVGGGAAGLNGAYKAAEQGVKVLVLEKMPFVGGASMMASTGINAGSSDLQLATESPYTADQFYEYAQSWDYGYDRIGYRVVPVRDDFAYTFAYNSADAANWVASLGVEMKASDNSHSLQLVTKENGAFGAVYMSKLIAAVQDHENIEIRVNTRATEILLDENGAVCGVKAVGPDGEYVIETRALLLATGGYASAGSEFFQKYAPEWDGYYSFGHAGAEGDGIVMADAVGAQLLGIDAITATTLTVGEPNKAGALSLANVAKKGAVLLNKEGERFVNEAAGTAVVVDAMKAQTDHQAYLFATDAILAENADLQNVVDRGLAVKADSLEELAEALGLDAAVVAESFRVYAENAANGSDAFEKEEILDDFSAGAYYGVLVMPARRICTGGIVVDGKAQVLDVNDQVIPGLYAAGETTAYGAHPLSASTIFGRQAADSIVAYLGK